MAAVRNLTRHFPFFHMLLMVGAITLTLLQGRYSFDCGRQLLCAGSYCVAFIVCYSYLLYLQVFCIIKEWSSGLLTSGEFIEKQGSCNLK